MSRAAGGTPKAKGAGLLAFVVQKHKATSLHYDLRLEAGGVMPSWSVPKGPSLDSGVKRLAMPTSDHLMEYRRFEGVLGGGYGAGAVMIWDEGTYDPEDEVAGGERRQAASREEAEGMAAKGLREGNLKFFLYGKKLRGSFALVRTAGLGGSREAWLLIKHRDEYSQPGWDAKEHDLSAVSGRTLGQIAGQAELGSLHDEAPPGRGKRPGDHGKRGVGEGQSQPPVKGPRARP